MYRLPTLICAAVTIYAAPLGRAAGLITFSDPARVVEAEGTGYDAIYVVDGLSGLSMTYTPSSPAASVKWTSYTSDGEAYATDVSGVTKGPSGATTLANLSDQTSYNITEGSSTTRVRIIDYSRCAFSTAGFTVTDAGDCATVKVECPGAAEIQYYTPVATRATLSRELTLEYPALQVVTDPKSAREELREESLSLTYAAIPSGGVFPESPAMDCVFTLRGDRFMKAFHGSELTATASLTGCSTVIAAVNAVETAPLKADNIKPTGGDGASGHYGGNAPVQMSFSAQVNDAVSFMQWQVSASPEFEPLLYTYPYADFSETFGDAGTTYVRFYAADTTGECVYISPTFIIDVGESALDCPNAFSPNGDGVNDVWKVSYRSIAEFECHIFDRWGTLLYRFDNPAGGWDGTRGGAGGKKVPAGAYYYVIKARGADGKDYKMSGDINIIYYR